MIFGYPKTIIMYDIIHNKKDNYSIYKLIYNKNQ